MLETDAEACAHAALYAETPREQEWASVASLIYREGVENPRLRQLCALAVARQHARCARAVVEAIDAVARAPGGLSPEFELILGEAAAHLVAGRYNAAWVYVFKAHRELRAVEAEAGRR